MIVWIIILCVSFAYFAYNLMIAVGWLKAPILHRFERYGLGDDAFTVLPALFLSFVLIMLSATSVITEGVFRTPMYALFVPLLYVLAWVMYRAPHLARKYPHVFLIVPRWYVDLRERTTREERRRIAYRWLALPRRTRQALSSNDYAFRVWADMVIIGTVTHTVEDDETLADMPTTIHELYY